MKKIALICNYKLIPERVGGMDYFFWEFDAKCKANNIAVDWFFPNISSHGNYDFMTIYSPDNQSLENYFSENFSTENYTHIITHFVELCTPFFKKIKKSTQAQIIAVDHNARPIQGYPLKKKINKKLKGFLFSKFIDVFVGVSQYSVNMLVNDFGNQISNKTKIVYNGINFEKFEKKESDFSFQNKFLVVSHLTHGKGIVKLLVAIKSIVDNGFKNFSITIYGEGNLAQTIKQKIIEYQLNEIITLKGNVANLNSIYKKYDYLIQPSEAETFSFSIIESLYCQVPVIVSKQANVLDLIVNGKNGYIFDIQKDNELKSILENVIENKKQLIFENKYFDVSAFSLKKMVENHFNLLQ